MSNNRIICHSNKITIVLSENEMQQWQKSIATDIADKILSDYGEVITVEDFNVEENRCIL